MIANQEHFDAATLNLTKAERITVRLNAPASDEQLLVAGNYDNVWGNVLTAGDFQLGEPFVGSQEMLVVQASNFPSQGRISGREGVEIMRGLGFRPPTLREMLAFGAQQESRKWVHVVGANLHYRVPHKPWYDSAPAIYSHSRRGFTVVSMMNGMIGPFWIEARPHYLWVSLP